MKPVVQDVFQEPWVVSVKLVEEVQLSPQEKTFLDPMTLMDALRMAFAISSSDNALWFSEQLC